MRILTEIFGRKILKNFGSVTKNNIQRTQNVTDGKCRLRVNEMGGLNELNFEVTDLLNRNIFGPPLCHTHNGYYSISFLHVFTG